MNARFFRRLIEERIAFLYQTDRLEERFRFFECFTLPSLRGQLDGDFTFVIVIGDSLPEQHRQRLDALVKDMPQVVIQSHPPKRHREVMKTAINSVRRFDDSPCLQFRLDDDDAVGIGFIARLREAALHLHGFAQDHRNIAIDFNSGWIAQPSAKGIAAEKIQKQYWTPALAFMTAPDSRATIMNFSHHNIWKWMPSLTIPGEDMILRGHNEYNDSRQKPNVRKFRLTPLDENGELRMKMSYNIDAAQVRKVFSRV